MGRAVQLSEIVESERFKRLPARFRRVLQNIRVETPSDAHSTISMPAAVGDWWCSWLQCRGPLRAVEVDGSTMKDYALLIQATSGHFRALGTAQTVVPMGHISLWRGEQPVTPASLGEVRYVITHIPLEELKAAAPDRDIPFGRSIPAFTGPGAVLATSLRTLAVEARKLNADDQLATLLPGLAKLTRQVFDQDVTANSETNLRGRRERMARVRDYIDAHFPDSDLSFDAVSRACGISQRQLYRDFHEERQTFSAIVRQRRLDRATLYLLSEPSMSVSEIAYACGFEHPSSFARSFHAIYGVPPREFAKRSRQSGSGTA